MIRTQLPDDEVDSLEQLLRATADAKLRHRAQIVLMAHRGRPHPEIAADTGTSQRSVQRWLNAHLDGGLDRLRSRKAKGAAPKMTEDLAPTLRQWVIGGPADQGLDRANWTNEELAEQPFRAEGIRVRHAGVLPTSRHPPLPADLPFPAGRPGEAGRGPGRSGRPQTGVEAGERTPSGLHPRRRTEVGQDTTCGRPS